MNKNTATFTNLTTGETVTLKADHYGKRDFIAVVARVYAQEFAASVGGDVFGEFLRTIEIREHRDSAVDAFSAPIIATVAY